jgi:hypothetical protein
MDKATFLRVAPDYYLLAITQELRPSSNYLGKSFFFERSEADSVIGFLESAALIAQAIEVLVQANALEKLDDPFGPTLYRKGTNFDDFIKGREEDRNSPFYKASAAPNRMAWLKSALGGMKEAYNTLGITETEIEERDREWEPIPLERTSESLQNAIAAIDETVAEVEKSNGYAAEHPEERNYVLSNLTLLSHTLKTAATTSIAFVRAHGLNILQQLAKRFGDAAIGKLVDVAIKALLAWLGLGS